MSTARDRTRQAQGKPTKADLAYKPFKVKVDGQEMVVDQNTFTGKERQLLKRELAQIGYEPDGEDRTYAAIWITMRRVDPSLTFDDVLESVTAGDYLKADLVDGAEDDSPEA